MNEKIKTIISRIKTYLAKRYEEGIKKIYLYGSYARNEQTKDSDIDVLVVVDRALNPFEVRESLNDLLFDMLLEEKELISVMVIPENIFKNYSSPFMLNVKKEGIAA